MRVRPYEVLRTFVVFLSLALTAVPTAASTEANENSTQVEIEDKLDFSAGLYVRNMYDMAAKEYQALIDEHPLHPQIDRAYLGLGDAHFFSKKYEEARTAYEDFLRQFEGHPKAAFAKARLGESFFQLDQKEKAKAQFLTLEKSSLDPVRLTAQYYLGRFALEQQDWSKAKQYFSEVMKTQNDNPFSELAYYYLGEIGLESGEFDEAEIQYNKLVQSEKKDMQQLAYFGLGKIYFQRKAYEEAGASFQKAASTGSDQEIVEDALLNRLKALNNLGNFENLAQEFEKAVPLLKTPSKQIEAQVLLANANVIQGNYEEAILSNEAVLGNENASDEQVESATLGKIEALILSRKFPEALSVLEGLSLDTTQAKDRYFYLQLEAHKGAENWEAALAALETLTQDYPESDYTAQALLNRGYLLLEEHDLAEARSALYEFSEKFPDHPMREKVHEDAIQVSLEIGDLSLAIEDAQKFLEEFPDSPKAQGIHYQLATFYSERGEYEQAHEAFKQHLDQYGRSDQEIDIFFRIGYNLQRHEKWLESLSYLKQVRKGEVPDELYYAALERRAYGNVRADAFLTAAELYQQIIEDYQENRLTPQVYFWVAKFQGEQKNASAMRSVLERLKLKPDAAEHQTEIHYYLAESFRIENLCDQGLPHYQSVLQNAGAFEIHALLGKGNCEAAVQNYDEAMETLKLALKGAGQDHELAVQARMDLAQVHELRGDFEEAGKGYIAIAILYEDPSRVPDALMKAGNAFATAGKNAEARQAYDELIHRFPEHPLAEGAFDRLAQLPQ